LELSDYIHDYRLLFQLQFDGNYRPVEEWGSHKYCYQCMSCYLACGTKEEVFTTDYAEAKDLKDGPTKDQQEQIRQHTKQHQIMLQWARSVK
jgi:hypothetical protein